MALLDPVLAGAEGVAVAVARALAREFRVGVATLRRAERIRTGLGWRGRTGDLRDLLFGEWDVLHTHLFLPGLAARLRRLWDPHVRWVHTVHYHDYGTVRLGRLKRWLDRTFVFPDADVLVAVSPLVKESLEGFPRVRLVMNAVAGPGPAAKSPATDVTPAAAPAPDAPATDTPAADTPAADTPAADVPAADVPWTESPPTETEAVQAGPARPTLATVAMLRPEKGVEDLLRAVALLRDRGRPVILRLAGDGPLRRRLETITRELGLGGDVRFEGYVADLEPFFEKADFYVQPSREEALGLSVLEAMARGLPLVVSEGGFLPRLVGEGRWGAVATRRTGESRAEALARTLEAALDEGARLAGASKEGWTEWKDRVRPEAMEEAHRKAVSDALLPRITVIQPVVTHATGGIQRQIRLQTRELTRLGHRIALVQRRDLHLDSDPELRKAWSHLEILQIPDPARLPLRIRGAVFVSVAVLRLALRRRGIDVYHSHQLFSPTLAAAGAKALRGGALVTKVTASGTLGEVRQLRALPFRRLRLRAFRTIDRIVVLHRAMVPEVLKLGIPAGTITVLPNAVEVPETAAEIRPGRGEGLSLLWVGRMSTEKGLEILLEAGRILGARLRARGGVPPVVHLVGGGDPDRDVEPSLRRMAAAFQSEVDVRFQGVRPDPSPFYRAGPVFVLPSRSEGMSNSLLEAMAWGLPCVASDIPSNRFLVDHQRTGLLFRDGDALSLATALEGLHRDLSEGKGELARRLGTGARERVKEEFSTEGVGRRLSGLYREVAQGR